MRDNGAPRGGGVMDRTPIPPFETQLEVPKLCKCSTCCYFNTAVTEFAPHHTEAKTAGWRVVRDIVISAGRGNVVDASPHRPVLNMFLMNTIFP